MRRVLSIFVVVDFNFAVHSLFARSHSLALTCCPCCYMSEQCPSLSYEDSNIIARIVLSRVKTRNESALQKENMKVFVEKLCGGTFFLPCLVLQNTVR